MTSLFMDSQVDTSSSVYQDEVAKANQRFYDQIAEVYDVDLDYVSKVTDKNALDIFGI